MLKHEDEPQPIDPAPIPTPARTPVCGALRPAGNGIDAMVCERDRGHEGPHGLVNAGVLYLRWPR